MPFTEGFSNKPCPRFSQGYGLLLRCRLEKPTTDRKRRLVFKQGSLICESCPVGILMGSRQRQYVILLTDAQFLDDSAVSSDVLFHQVIEQVPSASDHLQQATTGMMVVFMLLQMLCQIVDSSGEDGDLYLRRSGVFLMQSVGFDYRRFFLFLHHG